MGRLRVRSKNNAKWIDICQSAWYVRNQTNDGWIRITPASGLKARHGTDNYWINIDCLSEDDCGPDPYGGTPDGKGQNGTGSNVGGDVGYPGETDTSNGGRPFDPWDPISYKPPSQLPDIFDPPVTIIDPVTGKPIVTKPPINGGAVGGNSPGNPDYNDPEANGTDQGEGDSSCAQGSYSGGAYPPGFDLPDACGEGSGIIVDADGNASIYRPGLDEYETYDNKPKSSTDDSGADGSYENSFNCPVTVNNNATGNFKITEFYVELGPNAGTVNVDMLVGGPSRVSFIGYVGGKKMFESNGGVVGTKKRTFEFDPARTNGETKMVVRARRSSRNSDSQWQVAFTCPNQKPIGTFDEPAPCMGTFQPEAGGGAFTEVVHEMGPTAGQVVIDYQMWNVPDRISVWQHNTKLADTGTVSGEGSLQFDYTPLPNNTKITLRIESISGDTSWAYMISCPDATGSKVNPQLCDPDIPVASGGAGQTDLYFDMGSDPGVAQVRYQAWYVPDVFEVFQNGELLATTGSVEGEGYLPFPYDPAKGDVHVRVTGAGHTTWAFIMECPKALDVQASCGDRVVIDTADTNVITTLDRTDAQTYALLNYYNVPRGTSHQNTDTSTVTVMYNGLEIERRSNVRRFKDGGWSNLPIAMIPGVNGIAVSNTGAKEWGQIMYCPIAYTPLIGMSEFINGVDHAHRYSYRSFKLVGDVGVIGAQASTSAPLKTAQIYMNMFHAETTNTYTFTGIADDFGHIYIHKEGGPLIDVGNLDENIKAHEVALEAGTYFISVIVEEELDSGANAASLALEITRGPTVVLVTNEDWRAMYFGAGHVKGTNVPMLEESEAMMFESDAAANTYMNNNQPPSMQAIFNTWPRYDGSTMFNDISSATGSAANWTYNPSDSSFQQLDNTNYPNGIISPTKYTDYLFEFNVTSNSADNDGVGMIIAQGTIADGVYSLVVVRGGGHIPFAGSTCALGLNINGTMTLVEGWEVGDTQGNWNGRNARIRATRVGNTITVELSRYNSSTFTATKVIDLTSDPRFAPFLDSAHVGFYTESQPGTRFYNVRAPGLNIDVMSTSGRIWGPGLSSNGWVQVQAAGGNMGGRFSAPYNLVTNPVTNKKFNVFRYTQWEV